MCTVNFQLSLQQVHVAVGFQTQISDTNSDLRADHLSSLQLHRDMQSLGSQPLNRFDEEKTDRLGPHELDSHPVNLKNQISLKKGLE